MSQRNIFYYDQAANLSCVRDPDMGLTYYEYDLLDRVTSVKNPLGELTYYEYTPDDQVSAKVHGNGAVSYYAYDAVGRVSRIEHRRSDLSEIATLDYEYDRVGNPTKITREDGSATYYDYDRIYQLTGEVQVDAGGMVEYAFEYDYDRAHNRTLKVVDGTPTYYAYNEANQLVTETTEGATTYYRYDGRGNTVAKQEAAGTTYYAYNTENLMTRIDFAAGGNSYYDYDADSKRVSQRTADGYRQFVYQGPDMLALQIERDESEETVAHYTMGAGLEAMRRDSASSFYHYNHLGTALALTGADEAVTDAYRHDAWGVLLASTGSTVNPHTYVGRERYYRMPNAAMYHLGFRDYAQGVGRFTTVDPLTRALAVDNHARRPIALEMPAALLSLERGLRAYTYVGNAPVSLTDPTGLIPLWAWALIVAALAAIVDCIEHHVDRITTTYDLSQDFRFVHCAFSCELGRCLGANVLPGGKLGALLSMYGGTLWELGALILEEAYEHGLIDRATYERHKRWIGEAHAEDLKVDAIGAGCSMARLGGSIGRIGISVGIGCDDCCADVFCRLDIKLPQRFR